MKKNHTKLRIGIGYDAHQLVEKRPLILGGIEVPFTHGLLGHSDADVLLHALIDALIGAMSAGSIGSFFPDTDPQYKNISSLLLLQKTHQYLQEQNYTIENIDSVIITQNPKLSPFIPAMQTKIAQTLNLNLDQISIKAKTTEGLGFEGQGLGIAAQAIVLLSKV